MRVTIFEFFAVTGLIGGILAGLKLGHLFGGPMVGVVAAAVGAIVGLCVRLLPVFLTSSWNRWSLRRKSIAELRTRLNKEDYYWISLELIEELLARGEPLESLREYVAAQLASHLAWVQETGKRNASTWFPELLGTSDDERSPPIS